MYYIKVTMLSGERTNLRLRRDKRGNVSTTLYGKFTLFPDRQEAERVIRELSGAEMTLELGTL